MNTEFITKSPKVKTAAKVAGGGLTLSASAIVFLYATFVSKSEMEASAHRAEIDRAEMKKFQAETWQRLMDVQVAVENNRAALDMMIRMSARVRTNAVAIQ